MHHSMILVKTKIPLVTATKILPTLFNTTLLLGGPQGMGPGLRIPSIAVKAVATYKLSRKLLL